MTIKLQHTKWGFKILDKRKQDIEESASSSMLPPHTYVTVRCT